MSEPESFGKGSFTHLRAKAKLESARWQVHLGIYFKLSESLNIPQSVSPAETATHLPKSNILVKRIELRFSYADKLMIFYWRQGFGLESTCN